MEMPELMWPTTKVAPSVMSLLAAATPCSGLPPSSATRSSIFWPLMPPAALMSITACSTPVFICAPKAAMEPVNGPAAPIFTSARAAGARTRPAQTASAAKESLFIPIPSK